MNNLDLAQSASSLQKDSKLGSKERMPRGGGREQGDGKGQEVQRRIS